MHIYRIYLVIVCLGLFNVSLAQQYNLVWSDEFSGSSINSSYWDFDLGSENGGWGNNELQYYTNRPENAKVQDGNLIITAIKESYAGSFNYTSARMVTRNKVAWKYGRIEVRANIPEGTGIWPAIWMLPEVWNYGNGSWPDNGEIDIMEYVGYKPGTIHASLHNHNNYASNSITGTIDIANVEDNFHVYALEWTEDKIEMFVDDTKYHTYYNPGTGWEAWPWDKEFHLILNIAVGGSWGGAQGVDDGIFPQTMEVDYVKVYEIITGPQEVTLESAEVDANKTEINLDFNLDMAELGDEKGSFNVIVNNVTTYTVDSVYIDEQNAKRIKVRVKETFNIGDVISLDYTPGNIQATNGSVLAAFQGKLVKNIVTSTHLIDYNSNVFYPNPFENHIFFNTDLNVNSIEVFDITGKLIYRSEQNTDNYINTSEWPGGLLFLRYSTDKNSSTVRMLKAR